MKKGRRPKPTFDNFSKSYTGKPRAGARGLVVRELKVASLPPSEHPINPAQPCRCGVTPLIVTNPLKYAYFASDCVTL